MNKALSLLTILAASAQFAFCQEQSWDKVSGTRVSWGTTDFSFICDRIPSIKKDKSLVLSAWRGEKVFAKAVIWTSVPREEVSFVLSDLKGSDGSIIRASDCEAGFMMNVISDYDPIIRCGCNKGKEGVGFECDSILIPDLIDPEIRSVDMSAKHTQSIWITCPVPSNDYIGSYHGTLTILSKGRVIETLRLTVRSNRHILPAPADWKHLTDFWIHYYPLADFYGIPYWSDEYISRLKPILRRLAAAGQKTTRTTIAGNSNQNMIQWILGADGKWSFDYSFFDKCVEVGDECGLTGDINCAGLSHRKGTVFRYWDAASGGYRTMKPGFFDPEYKEMLVIFCRDFAKHLKEKGWFQRAMLSTDELGHDQNKFSFDAIREANPDFRFMTASNITDPDMEGIISYLAYASHKNFNPDILKRRKADGKTSLQYICCTETHPNRYVFSDPYECTYISYNTFCKGLDGFLCWAYCKWGSEPLKDTRCKEFYAGEYFMIYPYDKTSQRWEKYIEGVQDYEKLRILTEEYRNTGNTEAQKELDKTLKPFMDRAFENTRTAIFDRKAMTETIAEIKALLNR